MTANATVSLGSMLSSYPGPLTLVTVQVFSLVKRAMPWFSLSAAPISMGYEEPVSSRVV